jgi:multiple sugar transport system permease protein
LSTSTSTSKNKSMSMSKRGKLFGRQRGAAWVFLAPALSLIAVFFLLPILAGLLLSFTDFDLYSIGAPRTARFVGLSNYRALLGGGEFWQALRNTLYFVIVGGPLTVAVSLGAALLLSTPGLRLRGLFRTIYFAPVVTTMVAVAIVWRYLYHPHYGLLNYALGWLGLGAIDWLGDPRWAMPAIVLLAVWKGFGYNMLIFVAGLQSIPEERYEAAAVDGAGSWQRFRAVTLPGLGPVFLFVAVTTMIGYFQLFAEPYVMTQGGPVGATRSLVLFMYEEGFRWWRLGTAAAIAVLLLLITLVATLIQLRVQRGQQ